MIEEAFAHGHSTPADVLVFIYQNYPSVAYSWRAQYRQIYIAEVLKELKNDGGG